VGKNRYPKKPYTSLDRIKQKERLLPDEEVFHANELQERKRRVAVAIRMKDQELRKEQEEITSRGYCRHCYTILTTTGRCSNLCQER